jgi:aminoglycoside phosphotransferase (APT) family kinase protein
VRGYLRDHLEAPDLQLTRPLEPLRGGSFTAIWRFELRDPPAGWSGPLVLRFIAGMPMQVRCEAGLQDGARAAGVPAPRVVAIETDPEPLGQRFIVMELLPHRPLLGGVTPLRFARDLPRLVRTWPDRFEAVLRRLGAADPEVVVRELERHGAKERFYLTTRHLSWAGQVLGDERAFDAVLAWLRANEPPLPSRPALVHGDLWPGNVLADGKQLGGLVDWTMGAVGDPALDLGFAKVGLLLAPDPFPPPSLRRLVDWYTTRVAEEIHRRCAPLVGGDDRVRYFEAMRCVVQIAASVTERNAGGTVGWAHGMPALVAHLEATTGCSVPFSLNPTSGASPSTP